MFSLHPWFKPVAASLVLAVSSSAFAVVSTTTSVQINSYTAIADSNPDFVTSNSGALLELSAAGTNNLVFSGTSTVKHVSDDTYGQASLATGQLKTRASLGFGTDVSGPPVAANLRNGNASARVSMGDSFTTYSGSTPFIWTSGDTATFHFSVDGTATIPDGLASPASSKNSISATMTMYAFKPGTLDLLDQINNFDFGAYPTPAEANAAFNALNTQVSANTIKFDYWYLGTPLVPYAVDPAHVVDVNDATPDNLIFSFQPNGNFEWLMAQDTTVQLDASQQDVTASFDFSHTIDTTYEGPAGTTVYSASGVFPDTLPAALIPGAGTGVPEPLTAILGGWSVWALAIAATRRRSA